MKNLPMRRPTGRKTVVEIVIAIACIILFLGLLSFADEQTEKDEAEREEDDDV